MKLYSVIGTSILTQINTTIGAAGAIDFFSTTANIPTTGLLATNQKVLFAASAIGTFSTNGGDPTGTRCTAVFNAMTTGTAALTGTANYFAIFRTNVTTATDTANILFTGTVGIAASDVNFNTINWDAGDNVNITSLNFIAPLS